MSNIASKAKVELCIKGCLNARYSPGIVGNDGDENAIDTIVFQLIDGLIDKYDAGHAEMVRCIQNAKHPQGKGSK